MGTAHTELDANSNMESMISSSKQVENSLRKSNLRPILISIHLSHATSSKLNSARLQSTLTFWSIAWMSLSRSKSRRLLSTRKRLMLAVLIMKQIKSVSQSTNTWTFTSQLPQDSTSSLRSNSSNQTPKMRTTTSVTLLHTKSSWRESPPA